MLARYSAFKVCFSHCWILILSTSELFVMTANHFTRVGLLTWRFSHHRGYFNLSFQSSSGVRLSVTLDAIIPKTFVVFNFPSCCRYHFYIFRDHFSADMRRTCPYHINRLSSIVSTLSTLTYALFLFHYL